MPEEFDSMSNYERIMQFMSRYPDLWQQYLTQLTGPDGGNNVMPLSSLFETELATPGPSDDPWYNSAYGYTNPLMQQQMGITGAQGGQGNTQPDNSNAMNPYELLQSMGQEANSPGLNTGVGTNRDAQGNVIDSGVNLGEYLETIGNRNNQNAQTPDPTQEYDTLLDRDVLRQLFGDAVSGSKALKPMVYDQANFKYTPQPNPVVRKTMADILNTTKAYRGARLPSSQYSIRGDYIGG